MQQKNQNSEFRVVGNNDNQTTFGQTQSSSSEETNSPGNYWREVPGYSKARRFGSEEGCNESHPNATGY